MCDSAQKKKKKHDNEAKVQEIVDDHGTQYTVMQLCIWAELIAGGLYSSTSDPPSENSMFQRAGGSSSGQKKRYNWNYHSRMPWILPRQHLVMEQLSVAAQQN